MDRPFRHDPSTTGAFTALKDEAPVIEQDEPLRAVVIGGGTGAPISIQTLLSMGFETSAVIAMTDDGGSTGILREEADVTPPGDIRKCLAAFAKDPQDPLTKAFKYRFEFAQNHTLGNLLLSGLEDATGSFPEAIQICEGLLKARGHVYPSTLDLVTLSAKTWDGHILKGQANASRSKCPLKEVWLEHPSACRPYEQAVYAILNADFIVLGPGSLFTSIIPNLLVPGIAEAIKASESKKIFVCSLADMQGETKGMTASQHVKVLLDYGMDGVLDYAFVHVPRQKHTAHMKYTSQETEGLRGRAPKIGNVLATPDEIALIQSQGIAVIARDFVDPLRPTWHDPCALREALAGVVRLCRLHQR